jgi:DNA-binding NtrC family response regulator
MSSSDPPTSTAVVAAGDEETRVLLRGLLRLHHFRVVGEADGSTRALEIVTLQHPQVLITDVNLAEGSCVQLIEDSKRNAPEIRVILVTPAARPPTMNENGPGPDVILARPFKIRQFADALTPQGAGPAVGLAGHSSALH